MSFFRRGLELNQATLREATPNDLSAVSQLLHDSEHRFFSSPSADLPALLNGAPALLLVSSAAVWGALIAGWRDEDVSWIRALVLADGLPVGAGLDVLLPRFHAMLQARQVRRLFYTGDLAADNWIQPALKNRGYVRETDVIVYEKHGYHIPSYGNDHVRVRRAESVDLPAVLAVDRACFSVQWLKDEGILGSAIVDLPLFAVAEDNGTIAGYTFVTVHFGGRLVHLVRIAVHPAYQRHAIGVRLLAQVIAFAQTSGAHTVTLNTQLENHSAQRLYEWFGFRRTGERQTVLRYDL